MRCGPVCRLPGRVLGLRLLRISLVVVLMLLLVAGALTTFLPNNRDDKLLPSSRRDARAPGRAPLDSFTLVMQTYNRTDLLLRLLNHYQAVPHLHRVIVVWNNVGERTPEELWDSLGPHPVPVVFKRQATNRMRNRLQAFPELETSAVLMVDDDVLISAQDLVFAFSVWQQFPDQIVGFVPRKHVSTASGVYSYGGFELPSPGSGDGDQYSMVLIGASFFSSKYLDLFQRQPAAVHALIDETQNCDDIAMNFLVARHTGKASGLFVKPVNMGSLEKESSGGHAGLWHRAEHFLQRSHCVNKLARLYDGMPLQYSNLMVSQFGFPYANHRSKV
ncbi:exostosin-like 2 [Saccopteryx leptura]|uniref:exostosin-like 2 n=1 Tax=Saccopteryx leptura TaxID=249018 RepID=UPI00339D0DFC